MLKPSNLVLLSLWGLGLTVSGCGSLSEKLGTQVDQLTAQNSAQREFQTRVHWVTQGPAKENMKFRKINRFKPILTEHPKHGQILIQANSIDGLAALTTENGQVVWRTSILNGIEASGVLHKGRLLVGASDGQFYSIDPLTGTQQWSFPTRIENISEPVIAENLVIFLSGANTLYALDLETGKQVWLYNRQDTQAISVRGGSKPAFADGQIYAGFSDGAVVALNAKSGSVKWERQLNRNKRFRDVDSDPVVDGEFLYVSAFDQAIFCLRTLTGDVVWKSEKGAYGAPLVQGDTVYFSSTSGEFLALDRSSGRRKWAFPVNDGVATAGQIFKGLMVFGESRGHLQFVDLATGRQVGHFSPGMGVMSEPVVDEKNNRVYFISGEANIYSVKVGWGNAARIRYLR